MLWRNLLKLEAESWIGVTEATGHNDGQLIQLFQMAVNRYPNHEAWCMDFVVFCVQRVYAQLEVVKPNHTYEEIMPLNKESVISMWEAYQKDFMHDKDKTFFTSMLPEVGNIAVWRRGDPDEHLGHVGIITRVEVDHKTFYTVEGNSLNYETGAQGVWRHKHSHDENTTGERKLLGYVTPFILLSRYKDGGELCYSKSSKV